MSVADEPTTTLVERRHEMAVLARLLDECAEGSGRIALLAGGLASGKTALLHEFAEQAGARNALVLTATGSRAERTLQLGVIRQLFDGAALPLDIDEIAGRSPDEPTAGLSDQPNVEAAHGVCTGLLALARDRPVVLGIDDIQFADVLSLQVLLYLQRRMRSARIFLVLTELAQPRPAHPLFRAEVLSQRYAEYAELAPLTRAGVAELLSTRLGDVSADVVDTYHDVSGGNPLFVNALIEDYREAAPAEVTDRAAPVGATFGQAVLDCLHRWEPSLLTTARGVALLDAVTPIARLGRLMGIRSKTAAHAVEILTRNGLLDEGRFRHPVARAAVFDSIPADTRAGMHQRAAEELHVNGAAANVVATHLLAAHPVEETWAVNTLRHAAAHALTEDDLDQAVRFLERARQTCGSAKESAEITTMLMNAETRLGPKGTARHLGALQAAFAEGHLAEEGLLKVVKYLVWQGRPEEAVRTLSDWNGDLSPRGVAELKLLQQLTFYGDATLAANARVPAADLGSAAEGPDAQASDVLDIVFARGSASRISTAAENVLRSYRIADDTLEPLTAALLALMYSERYDRAEYWCDTLARENTGRQGGVWSAMLCTMRAEIALANGDLPDAAEQARSAIAQVSAQGWHIAVGMPMAALLRALTAMGEYDSAAELLRTPVPEAMYQTGFGVAYLRARGQYYLETGKADAAVGDFERCGEMARERGCDLPGVVPWRTEAARGYLRLGRPERARELASEQLGLPMAGGSRSRGTALRVLAAAGAPSERVKLLTEAVDLFNSSGSRLDLAYTLTDLSKAHHVVGDYERARVMSRRATQMAKACQAKALYRELVPSRMWVRTEQVEARSEEDESTLSDAERRVAVLAARGHTNREIGRKLFITVSTVEQHLTRVYRKLNVQRRADLRVQAVTGTST